MVITSDVLLLWWSLNVSDVNKATGHKAKARDLKAKAKDFQHSPRREQGQGHTATVRDQIKTSDVTYLLHSITVKIMITIR